jgi:tellurite resistance protein TerC
MNNLMQWSIFLGIILAILFLDLNVLNRKDEEITIKRSLLLSGFYICLALLFGLWVYYTSGFQKVSEYYTGYLVEESLSLDNLFVISLIFGYFHIPRKYQHRVLFWGIMGVIILRAIMIGLGAALVSTFEWTLYIFGILLLVMGVKMLFMKEKSSTAIPQNFILKFLRRHFRISQELHGHDFLTKAPDPKNPVKKVTFMTPLLVVLILIETADIIFAVDSIPAIFLITTDPYIVYTSNIFAILGLRSLYFALDAVLNKFIYLQQALALVLIFIGSKVFIAHLLGWEKFPPVLSLGITAGLLTGGIVLSLWRTKYGHTKTH